jgi:hypothetical protein
MGRHNRDGDVRVWLRGVDVADGAVDLATGFLARPDVVMVPDPPPSLAAGLHFEVLVLAGSPPVVRERIAPRRVEIHSVASRTTAVFALVTLSRASTFGRSLTGRCDRRRVVAHLKAAGRFTDALVEVGALPAGRLDIPASDGETPVGRPVALELASTVHPDEESVMSFCCSVCRICRQGGTGPKRAGLSRQGPGLPTTEPTGVGPA